MRRSTASLLWFSVLVFLCVSPLAMGQGTTSRVTGTVQDANGGALVSVTVTLTNEATGVSFTTETSDSGAYSFDQKRRKELLNAQIVADCQTAIISGLVE